MTRNRGYWSVANTIHGLKKGVVIGVTANNNSKAENHYVARFTTKILF